MEDIPYSTKWSSWDKSRLGVFPRVCITEFVLVRTEGQAKYRTGTTEVDERTKFKNHLVARGTQQTGGAFGSLAWLALVAEPSIIVGTATTPMVYV